MLSRRNTFIMAIAVMTMAISFIPFTSDAADADTFGVSMYDSSGKMISAESLQMTFSVDMDTRKYIDLEGREVTEYVINKDSVILPSGQYGIGIMPSGGSFILKMELKRTVDGVKGNDLSYLSDCGLKVILDDGGSETNYAVLDRDNGMSGSFSAPLASGKVYGLSIVVDSQFTFTTTVGGPQPITGIGLRLTAELIDSSVDVSFDPNGGIVSTTTKTVEYGEPYGDLPTPHRSGYSFNGWYTSETDGSRVTSETIVTDVEDHTLYAHWSYIPVPDPEPTPPEPKPPVPEHSESEYIGDDGSKTETEKETTTDGDRTTIIEKETVTKTDGSTQVTESTTVTEKTETGSSGTSTSTVTVRDSQGRLVSTTEITTTMTVDGDTKVTVTESVTKDPRGNVISKETTEIVDTDLGDGRTDSTSTTVKDTSDGKVTTETSSETSGKDGSTERMDTVVEMHTDPDGNILKVIETESTVTETTVSGSTVTKTDSKVTTKDAEGNVLRKDTVTSESSLSVSGKKTTTSSTSTTESHDAEGKLIGITESFSETTQSPGSDIVTEFRETFTSPDGETKVSEGVQNTTGDYSITTVAVVVTEKDGIDANAQTTLNYLGEATLDSEDVDRAYDHSVKTTQNMEKHNDMSRDVRVNTGFGVSAKATSGAMGRISDLGMGLYIEGSIGSLRYDAESCRGFSDFDKEIAFSLVKDAVDVLTEAQKVVVGSNSFVSVSAYAGAEYVTDLGGTVTISFDFNPGLLDYVACYIADDGSTEEIPFDYDQSTGKVSMRSTHHSVYAMLPAEEPSEEVSATGYLLFILIVVIIAASVAIIVWRNRA